MTTAAPLPRPPFDSELSTVLDGMASQIPSLTPELILPFRGGSVPGPTPVEIVEQAGLDIRHIEIHGHKGATIGLSVVREMGHVGPSPAFYYTHGGGMVLGDRWTGFTALIDWIKEYHAVAVTVEYRLAPECPDPVPIEDSYAGLVYTADNAATLGIDPARLMLVGSSAGGGIAAGLALLARDRQGPPLIAQMLMYPMLDDRDQTISTQQIDGVGIWDRASNRTGWGALLGARRGTDDVSIYAAPARSTNLSNLPPAFIDCGSAEVFRDEDVAYASAIWAAGGDAELHVRTGGFHGFEAFAPHTALAHDMIAARDRWIRRVLSR